MSLPTWPSTLPQVFQQSGYSETPPDLLVRTQMAVGPPLVRRRATAGVRQIKGTMLLTVSTLVDQVSILDDFYVTSTFSGAIQFIWTSQRPLDGTVTAENLRFSKPPSYRNVGGTTWEASLELELMP